MPEIPPVAAGTGRFRIIAFTAVMVAAALAYTPGLRNEFVHDDHPTIEENRFLGKAANLRRVLTLDTLSDPQVIDGQRPTLLLTSMIDLRLWGLRPFGWHLTNLAIHLAATAAVLWLFLRLARRAEPDTGRLSPRLETGLPYLLALFFALHPAWSEAVQLPSYREDLLAGLFTLLYAVACAHGSVFISLIPLAWALLSKESAVIAPALGLLVWWLLPIARPSRSRTALHLVLAAALLAGWAYFAYHARPLQALHAGWNGYSLRGAEILTRAPGILLLYLRLLVIPWPLCADHAVPRWNPVFGISAVLALLMLAWRMRRTLPLVTAGLLWILIAFIPVSNLVPLFNPVGERYLYLMAPGFLLVVYAFARKSPRSVFVTASAVLIFAALLPARLADWRNDETLWQSVLRVNPDSARACTRLGVAAKFRDDRDEAARLIRRAYDLNPNDIDAVVNLAIIHGEGTDLGGAEWLLRKALKQCPDRPDIWQNLALALRLQGRAEEALKAEEEYRRLAPRW